MSEHPKINIDRAARIDKLAATYQKDCLCEHGIDPTGSYISSMLADIRHWCDINDEDFAQYLESSAEHHAQEQGGNQ